MVAQAEGEAVRLRAAPAKWSETEKGPSLKPTERIHIKLFALICVIKADVFQQIYRFGIKLKTLSLLPPYFSSSLRLGRFAFGLNEPHPVEKFMEQIVLRAHPIRARDKIY